jgi:myo-inositol-1(or 4)-monophosphatase
MAASLDTMLDIAHEAVRTAMALLRDVEIRHITSKGSVMDLVTEWDTRSEETIRKVLETRSPGVPILGEEGGGAETADTRWLVDPIDGTVNFAHGLPIWGISVGLEVAGRVEVGVVAAPATGWYFHAKRGGGSFEGERRLRVSSVPKLERALLTTGFPYDRATNPDNNFAHWEHMQRVAGGCRRLGAASLDLCFVARGWCDGYWERRLHAWDIAAGSLICEEAGATVTNLTGGAFDVSAGEVVASNGVIHQELIAELGRVRTQS